MGNALSSGPACPMEEDILRFIESDSFKFLIAEEAADEIEELDVREKRKGNVIQRCANLWETNWVKMLLNPATADIETWEGKKFRRRFRMDYRMFREVLVPMCKEINVFEMKISPRITLEFKILVALRMTVTLCLNCLTLVDQHAMKCSNNLSQIFPNIIILLTLLLQREMN